MPARVGDEVPDVTLYGASADEEIKLRDVVGDKHCVLFGLPGAFTPDCSASHLPNYVKMADDFHKAGIEEIICMSVNDPYVMHAWAEANDTKDKVFMLADMHMEATKAFGMEADQDKKLGTQRCHRFSAVFNRGKITHFNPEDDIDKVTMSSAEATLQRIKESAEEDERRAEAEMDDKDVKRTAEGRDHAHEMLERVRDENRREGVHVHDKEGGDDKEKDEGAQDKEEAGHKEHDTKEESKEKDTKHSNEEDKKGSKEVDDKGEGKSDEHKEEHHDECHEGKGKHSHKKEHKEEQHHEGKSKHAHKKDHKQEHHEEHKEEHRESKGKGKQSEK